MGRFPVVVLLVAAAAVVSSASAREPRPRVPAKPVETHDLLAAEAEGLVTVKYIPNDSRSAQIVVTNRSDRPLTLRMPPVFAGVPVLAQFGAPGGMPNNGNAGFGAAGAPQVTGGAQPMNAGIGIGQPPGGGFMSIPPEKTRITRVTTVCLEHGKPEPSPQRTYKLVELAAHSDDPRLEQLMLSIGKGELSQKVAQAAAWHITNGLTWERLAAEMIDHAGGVPDEPYFTPAELQAAFQVVDIVTKRAEAVREASPGAGEYSSR